MDLGLKGKAALVAASSQGLGKAVAKQLVMEGADVLITSRNEEKLQAAKEELSAYGTGKVAYIRADITHPEDIRAMVQKARDTFGRLDILVNNAGGPPAGSFEDMADEDWQKSFELNLLSYIRIIREALPLLKKNGGRIINIASSSIKEPIPGLILSNTFRTGIVGLSKTLAEEFAPYQILVNTVGPGRIATDRIVHLDKVTAEKTGKSMEEVQAKELESIPLGRYGEPDEFGKFVAFLASEANSYVTGSSFLIDGGKVKSI
ncbi:SDR family oxidoreductase [Weizmannia coagulans]|jgi:3-oxoacyl-[acyl-carrier protein] reductase|uniref:Short-chain dehydrogenase/reductase SDR n=3 Tax=Heyndrickxia TaxID=2837504 RepID=G2TLG4_HEYCO|nr:MULTISPECIES: SDR family oxidoreductase [Heyndrickxia]AEO99466.1 short-chain dehydrogenase/reductase SDR [Heyndrickxia coagulans 36D1]AJO23591.1 short-chain dehydrogenase/reductase SDR [Heyndrickxia coagulans]AKN54911.1 3-oxoacyl-[acyl-carrier protein] reductase [Heyndrickxia coagulans]APB35719.1 3-oxoacyl-ACP reductase [Heyndrickxia coagulans]ATW83685.1 3-oxoacyl-ACP reductase [Heyndrickxia coagulans]